MKNIGIKISLATVSIAGFVPLVTAGNGATIPEPGMFGMFAGAIAVVIVMSRIIKKK